MKEYLIYFYQFWVLTALVFLFIDVILCLKKNKWNKKDTIGSIILIVLAFVPIINIYTGVLTYKDIRKGIR